MTGAACAGFDANYSFYAASGKNYLGQPRDAYWESLLLGSDKSMRLQLCEFRSPHCFAEAREGRVVSIPEKKKKRGAFAMGFVQIISTM